MRTLLSFCFALLLPAGVALSGTIQGRVLDATSLAPLSGADVLLSPDGRGTASDSGGRFTFTGVTPGRYTVSAGFLGYRVAKRTILLEDGSLEVTLKLAPVFLSGEEVVLTAGRAREGETPSSFTNVSGARLRENYWAQDIPPLLEELPGLYAYSETGMGVGYTHLKIRGFDETRIGVTINGIPLNDPEDGNVYWVDMPDLAASLQDVQVQRGIGYSNYGTGGFGGTLNLLTTTPSLSKPSLRAGLGAGSFNTRKASLSYTSGLVENTYGFYGRFSRVQTAGYRDRSQAELWSYFLSAARYGERSLLRLNVFGGPELTHAAWDASAESDIEKNRRDNPITYENTIDNFNQPHYELHHQFDLTPNLNVTNSLFYIRGEGYYEQLKENKKLADFGYQPFTRDDTEIERTDFVNRKWVKKDHLGWVSRVNLEHDSGTLQAGWDAQWFESDHYGYVLWGRNLPPDAEARHRYYRYQGGVRQGGAFLHEVYRPSDRWRFIGDLELRLRSYRFEQLPVANFQGDEVNRFTVDYAFFNPKFGATCRVSDELSLFASAGLSHRAPTDDEYWDVWDGPDNLGVDPLFNRADTVRSGGSVVRVEWSDPRVEPERLVDIELGGSWGRGPLRVKANGYWMDFRNEIIPAGGVRDGSPVTDNADRSVHRGIELEAHYRPNHGFFTWGTLTLSDDRLQDFVIHEYDSDWNVVEIDLSGNRIALFPSLMTVAGAGYRSRHLSGWVDARHVGKQYLDNTEDESRMVDPFTLVGLTLTFHPQVERVLPGWELSLRVNNLFDTEYETSGWYDAWAGENFYFVGAERSFFLSLTARL